MEMKTFDDEGKRSLLHGGNSHPASARRRPSYGVLNKSTASNFGESDEQSGNLWLDAALDAKFQRSKRTGTWYSRTWHFLQTFSLIIFIGMLGSLWAVGLDYAMDSLNHVRESISCIGGMTTITKIDQNCLDHKCACIQVDDNTTISSPSTDAGLWSMYFLWSCSLLLCGFLISNLVSLTVVGSGIPRMKSVLSGTHIHHFLSLRTLLAKSVGLILCFSSGLPIGREGPYVHLSCCIAIMLMRTPVYRRYLKSSARRIDMLTVAMSTGVSAAFGTPFGGVVFAVEVVSQYFYVPNLPRMFLAALSGTFIVKMLRSGNDATTFVALFKTSFTSETTILSGESLAMILSIGVVCGLLSGLFVRLVSKIVSLRRKYAPSPTSSKSSFRTYLLYFCIVAMVLSLMNSVVTRIFWETFPAIRTQRTLIDTLFLPGNELSSLVWHLGALLLVNFFLTAACLTLPIPAGLFIPVLVIGALTGRFAAGLVCADCKDIFGYEPGVYAVVGAASFAAGTTRAISTAVIVTEVTGQPHLLLPISLGVLAAYFVANRLSKPAYDSLIEVNQFPQLPKLSYKLGNSPAQACARPSTAEHCLRPDDTILDAYNLLMRGSVVVEEVEEVEEISENDSNNGGVNRPRTRSRVKSGHAGGGGATSVGVSIPIIRSDDDMVLLGEVQTSEVIKMVRAYLGKDTTTKDLKRMHTNLTRHGQTVSKEDLESMLNVGVDYIEGGGDLSSALESMADQCHASSTASNIGNSIGNHIGNEGAVASMNVLSTQIPFAVEDGVLSDTFTQRTEVERQFGSGKSISVEPVRCCLLFLLSVCVGGYLHFHSTTH